MLASGQSIEKQQESLLTKYSMKKLFTNRCVLVTGVGKGIGKSILKNLSESGTFVYGITRSNVDIKKLGKNKNFKIFRGDVRNINLINKILKTSIKERKLISGLVNNAGIRQRIKFEKITNKKMKEVFENNFFSIFEIMKIYLEYCKKFKIKSSIVNIGSIVGEVGFEGLSGYSSSKGALKSLTQSFAVESAKYGIRANMINPGFIKSSYFKKFKKNKKLYNWTISRTPLKRWGESREVSDLVKFLISDESTYITGESINIDGGWLNS